MLLLLLLLLRGCSRGSLQHGLIDLRGIVVVSQVLRVHCRRLVRLQYRFVGGCQGLLRGHCRGLGLQGCLLLLKLVLLLLELLLLELLLLELLLLKLLLLELLLLKLLLLELLELEKLLRRLLWLLLHPRRAARSQHGREPKRDGWLLPRHIRDISIETR